MKRLSVVVLGIALVLTAFLYAQTSNTGKSASATKTKSAKKAKTGKTITIEITADSSGDPQAPDKKLTAGDSATWNNQYGAKCRITFDPFQGPTEVPPGNANGKYTVKDKTPAGTYAYVLECDATKHSGSGDEKKVVDPAIIITN